MKRFKFSSFILASAMFLSTVSYTSVPVYAEDEPSSSDNGMVISKTAKSNGDGTYKITLEAYATGEKIISEVTKDVPTDIVLVLDQSGSMDEKMNTYDFREYTDRSNAYFYSVRHNGADNPNLYYLLDDGSYSSVSVTIQQNGLTYTQITNGRNNSSKNSATNYWNNRNIIYALVDGEYKKVTVTQEKDWWDKTIYYVYRLPDGTTIARSPGDRTSPSFTGIEGDVLYLASIDENQNIYTYTYTDKKNVTHTIGTSTGANELSTEFQLYERYIKETVTRIKALENAVTTFSNNVAKKAAGPDGDLSTTKDNINHRIAVVGFASGGYYDYTNYDYGNTEVFVGDKQYKYGKMAQSVYSKAFQDMNTTQGQSNVSASINALDANGGTLIDLGVEMANGILNANPIPDGEKRNRVIVVFTDGQPGWSGYDGTVADEAIKEAKKAKNSGVTVYTVGIFGGADATSAGSNASNATTVNKSNWFMQNLSSNNGVVRNPSYYLSAADADTLTNIFQQISDQIESGGSSTTLGAETVVKDIISPQFTLPDGATSSDITLETYACTGMENAKYTWKKNANALGATAEVNGSQVNVSGFNFSENYVGTVTENGNTTYRGNKLVISFTVSPKAGFLGGNDVYTNSSAGIYENSTQIKPVLEFNRPQVNVPIGKVVVTPLEKNIYVLGDLTVNQLKNDATITCGRVKLDLSKSNENYGLDSWQTEYVDISVVVKDKDGNVISSDLSELKEDQQYTIQVTVSPKVTNPVTTEGETAVERSGSDSASINVFKPVVNVSDTIVYYGDDAPTDYGASYKWMHNTTDSDTVTMIGDKPELELSFTAGTGIVGDKINTKNDIPVDVTVEIKKVTGNVNITEYSSFDHSCEHKETYPDCEAPTDGKFWLHVKTGDLTVAKNGGTDGEHYLFEIYKKEGDAFVKYTETRITYHADAETNSVTIYELPVGLYQVKEVTKWSWRDDWKGTEYVTYDGSNKEASITSANSCAKATVTNERTLQYWLNGFSDVVRNVFGQSNY